MKPARPIGKTDAKRLKEEFLTRQTEVPSLEELQATLRENLQNRFLSDEEERQIVQEVRRLMSAWTKMR